MQSLYRVGIIGCGKSWKSPGATGFGMARAHARGYLASGIASLTALADISQENARAFQSEIGGERIYTDFREMLAKEQLDIVSISTWIGLHSEMVIACAEANVKAIHCEKPMAASLAEARRMVQACSEHGVQLTFNHQRRFDSEFRRAKELLKAGAIGALLRLEAGCPNLFDWGTHWFDMLFFYNDDIPVEWVIGQIERHGGDTVFGVTMEEQGLSYYRFQNDVTGLLMTGHSKNGSGFNRLIGSDGMIEIDMTRPHTLRIWGKGQTSWQEVITEKVNAVELGIIDLLEALQAGREPELSARRAYQATELIFATYASSKLRGRMELPLQLEDFHITEALE
jgi:UDP-N-acetylglucosamine 3-dehydrogenase